MNELVRKDALQTLGSVMGILRVKEEKDIQELKELSNHTIHNASVFQDDCSVSVAVVVYALSKIIERNPEKLNYAKFIKILEKARNSVANNDGRSFSLSINLLFSEISNIDSKLKFYVQEVINEAQVKKGCKLCEHGLSTAKASQLIGVSQWEMMRYLGNTKLNEHASGIDVKSRVKFARGLFS
ncbi:hypothetical protein HYU09_01475 [Candidatus Woesearchaeota archaeon]|nr:hypothetical protein [Candidatus Woesearchaeota archaeon]